MSIRNRRSKSKEQYVPNNSGSSKKSISFSSRLKANTMENKVSIFVFIILQMVKQILVQISNALMFVQKFEDQDSEEVDELKYFLYSRKVKYSICNDFQKLSFTILDYTELLKYAYYDHYNRILTYGYKGKMTLMRRRLAETMLLFAENTKYMSNIINSHQEIYCTTTYSFEDEGGFLKTQIPDLSNPHPKPPSTVISLKSFHKFIQLFFEIANNFNLDGKSAVQIGIEKDKHQVLTKLNNSTEEEIISKVLGINICSKIPKKFRKALNIKCEKKIYTMREDLKKFKSICGATMVDMLIVENAENPCHSDIIAGGFNSIIKLMIGDLQSLQNAEKMDWDDFWNLSNKLIDYYVFFTKGYRFILSMFMGISDGSFHTIFYKEFIVKLKLDLQNIALEFTNYMYFIEDINVYYGKIVKGFKKVEVVSKKNEKEIDYVLSNSLTVKKYEFLDKVESYIVKVIFLILGPLITNYFRVIRNKYFAKYKIKSYLLNYFQVGLRLMNFLYTSKQYIEDLIEKFTKKKFADASNVKVLAKVRNSSTEFKYQSIFQTNLKPKLDYYINYSYCRFFLQFHQFLEMGQNLKKRLDASLNILKNEYEELENEENGNNDQQPTNNSSEKEKKEDKKVNPENKNPKDQKEPKPDSQDKQNNEQNIELKPIDILQEIINRCLRKPILCKAYFPGDVMKKYLLESIGDLKTKQEKSILTLGKLMQMNLIGGPISSVIHLSKDIPHPYDSEFLRNYNFSTTRIKDTLGNFNTLLFCRGCSDYLLNFYHFEAMNIDELKFQSYNKIYDVVNKIVQTSSSEEKKPGSKEFVNSHYFDISFNLSKEGENVKCQGFFLFGYISTVFYIDSNGIKDPLSPFSPPLLFYFNFDATLFDWNSPFNYPLIRYDLINRKWLTISPEKKGTFTIYNFVPTEIKSILRSEVKDKDLENYSILNTYSCNDGNQKIFYLEEKIIKTLESFVPMTDIEFKKSLIFQKSTIHKTSLGKSKLQNNDGSCNDSDFFQESDFEQISGGSSGGQSLNSFPECKNVIDFDVTSISQEIEKRYVSDETMNSLNKCMERILNVINQYFVCKICLFKETDFSSLPFYIDLDRYLGYNIQQPTSSILKAYVLDYNIVNDEIFKQDENLFQNFNEFYSFSLGGDKYSANPPQKRFSRNMVLKTGKVPMFTDLVSDFSPFAFKKLKDTFTLSYKIGDEEIKSTFFFSQAAPIIEPEGLYSCIECKILKQGVIDGSIGNPLYNTKSANDNVIFNIVLPALMEPERFFTIMEVMSDSIKFDYNGGVNDQFFVKNYITDKIIQWNEVCVSKNPIDIKMKSEKLKEDSIRRLKMQKMSGLMLNKISDKNKKEENDNQTKNQENDKSKSKTETDQDQDQQDQKEEEQNKEATKKNSTNEVNEDSVDEIKPENSQEKKKFNKYNKTYFRIQGITDNFGKFLNVKDDEKALQELVDFGLDKEMKLIVDSYMDPSNHPLIYYQIKITKLHPYYHSMVFEIDNLDEIVSQGFLPYWPNSQSNLDIDPDRIQSNSCINQFTFPDYFGSYFQTTCIRDPLGNIVYLNHRIFLRKDFRTLSESFEEICQVKALKKLEMSVLGTRITKTRILEKKEFSFQQRSGKRKFNNKQV